MGAPKITRTGLKMGRLVVNRDEAEAASIMANDPEEETREDVASVQPVLGTDPQVPAATYDDPSEDSPWELVPGWICG